MKVAIYTRVSTDRQSEEGFSLEAQHEKLMNYVKLQGWELLRVYTDPGISAKDLNRPGVQEMITDLKAGKLEAVIVHKLDRLTRNIGDLYSLVELVNKHDVKLISLSENIDTSTPGGRMFVYFLGIFAQLFRENLREEVLKGMTKRAEKGLRNGAHAPFGYDLGPNNELVVNEESAEWVKRIYSWYIEKGWGYGRICTELNALNISGNRGGIWHQNIVQYILQNPTYIGKVHWKPQKSPENERIIRDGDHTPIIDEVTYYRAQEQMKRRSLKELPRSANDTYPFSGLVRCGSCGYPFHGRTLKHKYGNYFNYRCYGKQKMNFCTAPDISEKKLEKLLFDHLRIVEEQLSLGRLEAAPTSQGEYLKERKRIEKELSKSETRRKNWMYAMGDGKLPYEDYVKLIDEEMERVKSLQEQLEAIPDVQESPVNDAEMLEVLRNLRENWTYLEPSTKRNMMHSFYKKIVIQYVGQWTVKEMVIN